MTKKEPIILTMDGGGTTFSFSALQNGEFLSQGTTLPAFGDDLDKSLNSVSRGFQHLLDETGEKADAISIAFPGPADYGNGVIGDLPNLPAYRGGVALGPYLEKKFDLPVFINNDGNLFALGESIYGLLPVVNQELEESGNPLRYQNLIGITLGTGIGAGICLNGRLLSGDNDAAGEVWKVRNKRHSYSSSEDTVSTHSLKRMYAEQVAIDPAKSPDPLEIFEIAIGKKEGVREAAIESYLRYGEVLGDVIAQVNTVIDGLVVIGGGVSGAYPLFARSMFDELNGFFNRLNGRRESRMIQKLYDLENDYQRKQFLNNEMSTVLIPGSEKKVSYQSNKKTGVGLTKLGAAKAISLGAYQFAAEQLKGK